MKSNKPDINGFIDAHDQIVRNLKMLESLLKNTDSEFEFLYGISGVLTDYLTSLDIILKHYLE